MSGAELGPGVDRQKVEAALADPAFASLRLSGAPIVAIAADPVRVVFASEAASALFGGGLDAIGRRLLHGGEPGATRIVALSRALLPGAAPRLERLRFFFGPVAETVTVLCRRVAVAPGETLFALAVLGMRAPQQPLAPQSAAAPVLPISDSIPVAAPPEAEAEGEESEEGAGAAAAAASTEAPRALEPDAQPASPPPPRATRFAWRTDADHVLTHVAPGFAAALGAGAAGLLGRSFVDFARDHALDDGSLAAALAARDTFNGLEVLWPAGEGVRARVTLGAAPAYDAEERFEGFRGFGVVAPDRQPVAAAAVPESAASDGVEPPSPADGAPLDTPPQEMSAKDFSAPRPPATEPPDVDLPVADPPPLAVERECGEGVAPEPSVLAEAAPPAPLRPEPAPAPLAVATVEPSAQAPAWIETGPPLAPLDLLAPAPPADPLAEFPRVFPAAPADRSADDIVAVTDSGAALTRAETQAEVGSDPGREASPPAPSATPDQPDDESSEFLAADVAPPSLDLPDGESPPAPQDRESEAPVAARDASGGPAAAEEGEALPADAPPPPPASGKIVPLRPALAVRVADAPRAPGLSPGEKSAFEEIARALGAEPPDAVGESLSPAANKRARDLIDLVARFGRSGPPETPAEPPKTPLTVVAADAAPPAAPSTAGANVANLLDRLPVGVVVSRFEAPLYANRTLLDLLDYPDVDAFHAAGGLDRLFHGRAPESGGAQIETREGELLAVDARVQAVDWDGQPATLVTFRRAQSNADAARVKTLEQDLRQRDAEARELHAILDTATDGVAVLDSEGRILSLNRAGEALFGYDQNEVVGQPFATLVARENQEAVARYFEDVKSGGVKSVLNDGREIVARAHQGGAIPVFVTLGRLGAGAPPKFCAVMRDLTAWKKAERELGDARREAERASALKSDFLAKISHEIRTPLNAILGFAEVIMDESFGPVGNARYRDYMRDIHKSGEHVLSLVNDLLDLSKIEAGKVDLTFSSVDINAVVAECVSLMQPQANRDRVVVRLSLAPNLPNIVADERSMRQIVLNVLSNAVKFNEPGGQVIVSTALTDAGHAVVRIKDTGVGMSDDELETALEPFRQVSTARKSEGTGLGLPLTKALVEANRAAFTIKSRKGEGTLVEVTFPPTRVLAE